MSDPQPEAWIFDGDSTLWEGKLASAIGKKYIKREIKSFFGELRKHNLHEAGVHLKKAFSGIVGALRVYATAKVDGDARGLEEFYKVLVNNGLGEEQTMYEFAGDHIKTHELTVVSSLLKTALASKVPVYLVSSDGSTGIRAARDYFGSEIITISNNDTFKEGKLQGIDIVMPDGNGKLFELQRRGIDVSKCYVVDDHDKELLIAARRGYAPKETASRSVKRLKNVRLL